MKTVEGDDALLRAEWIIRHSQAATLCRSIVNRSTASVHTSRSRAVARRLAAQFQSLPIAERNRCVLLMAAIALAGHVVMASLLPPPARPLAAVSALLLLVAALAILTVTRRRSS